MYLKIDPGNGVPIYLQIMEQIKHAIALNIFEVGQPIPTIRALALELKVNPNTVAKAVRELEREGILKTYVGKGAFVADDSQTMILAASSEKAEKVTDQYVKDVKWLGLDKKHTHGLIDNQWDKEPEDE